MLKRGFFSNKYFDNNFNFLSVETDPVSKQQYIKPLPISEKPTVSLSTLLLTPDKLPEE